MGAFQLSKKEIFERVGHINQIAGFKKYILKEGKKDGVNAVDIWNGSGLYMTILSDRASDISSLSYKGKSLCWISNLNISSPKYLKNGAFEWNNNFSGGMFATCGVTTAGLPSTDEGEQLDLHGPISNIPSEEINCRTYWEGDEYFIQYTAKTYQSKPFGENICVTRDIVIKMEDDTVYIHDNIENLGFKPIPFMMIYHMNFGYPLLDEGSKLYLNYDERFPTSELAKETESDIGVITKPDDGYIPRAYNHKVSGDEEGFAYSSIINNKIKLGATVKFKADELDKFNLWKCLQKSNYVVGLEPSNCRTWGRDKERENHELSYIEPFESRDLYFEIQIHDGENKIKEAVGKYQGTL